MEWIAYNTQYMVEIAQFLRLTHWGPEKNGRHIVDIF